MQRGVGAWCRDLVTHVRVCVCTRASSGFRASRVYKLFSYAHYFIERLTYYVLAVPVALSASKEKKHN